MRKREENKKLTDCLAALTLIRDIGYDYDGYSGEANLKLLIDELVEIARVAIRNNREQTIRSKE